MVRGKLNETKSDHSRTVYVLIHLHVAYVSVESSEGVSVPQTLQAADRLRDALLLQETSGFRLRRRHNWELVLWSTRCVSLSRHSTTFTFAALSFSVTRCLMVVSDWLDPGLITGRGGRSIEIERIVWWTYSCQRLYEAPLRNEFPDLSESALEDFLPAVCPAPLSWPPRPEETPPPAPSAASAHSSHKHIRPDILFQNSHFWTLSRKWFSI